jgi:hypothetical protein
MGIVPYMTLVILNSRIFNDLRLHLKHRRACSVLESRHPNNGEKVFNECCIPLRRKVITKKNQMLLAKTNLVMVLMFILCHSLRWIPNIYEYKYNQMYDDQSWIQSIEPISHLLITLSSSANSYIYRLTHYNIFSKIKRSIRRKGWNHNIGFNGSSGNENIKYEEVEIPTYNLRTENNT